MKKLTFLSALIMACCILSSCGNSDSDIAEPTNGSTEQTTKAITINLNEETISASTQPMMRAYNSDGKRYYAINIWEKSNKNYMKYAYGLFDGSASISAVMTEGKTYKIEVLEFRNDKDTLYHDGPTFYEPMLAGGTTPTQLTNSFTYDKKVNLSNITTGKTKLGVAESDTAWYPQAYKYYTLIEDFDPSTANSLTINVKRAFFGLHFNVAPPKYGTVKLVFLRSHSIEIKSTDQAYDEESFYSFNKISSASVDGYSTVIAVDATWSANGEVIQHGETKVPVKRNAITNLNINFSGPKDVSQIIDEETTPMDTLTHNWTLKVE